MMPKKNEFRIFGVYKVISKKTLPIQLPNYLLWINGRIGLKETLILIDDLDCDFQASGDVEGPESEKLNLDILFLFQGHFVLDQGGFIMDLIDVSFEEEHGSAYFSTDVDQSLGIKLVL